MRRTLLITGLLVPILGVASVTPSHATEVGYGRKFGLGVMVGEPTGLTGKLWVGPTNAIDFGLGFFSYGYNNCYTDSTGQHCWAYTNYSVVGDYLWQSNLVRGTAQLDWHLGAGAKFVGGTAWDHRFNNTGWNFGPRGSIGLDLMFQNPNFLEVFFELAPVLYLLGPGFDIDAALGVRFYF